MNLKIAYSFLKSISWSSILKEEYRSTYVHVDDPCLFIKEFSKSTKLSLEALALHEVEANKNCKKHFKRQVELSDLFDGQYIEMKRPSKDQRKLWGVGEPNSDYIDHLLLKHKDETYNLISSYDLIDEINFKCCVGVVERYDIKPNFSSGVATSLALEYISLIPEDFEVKNEKKISLRKDVGWWGLYRAAAFVYFVLLSAYMFVHLVDWFMS